MPAPVRLYFFVFICLLIVLAPSGAPPQISPPGTSTTTHLEALRNATFHHPPGNTTFPPPPLLSLWAKTKSEIRNVPAGSVFRNATSSVQGSWSRLEDIRLPPPPHNATDYARNITLDHGLMYLTIEDAADETVRMTLRVKDEDGGSETHVGGLRGVHFPETGEMVAVSRRRIWELPFMMTDEGGFNRSREVVERIVVQGEEWEIGEDDYQGERCAYVVYVQLRPTQLDEEQIGEVERELRDPTGLRIPETPRVAVSSLVYSRDCGVLLTSEMDGEKAEVFLGRVSNMGLGAAAITAVQMGLLIRQMERSNTPSTQSRVSFWTIVMLAVVDGYFFLVYMIVAIYLEACFLSLASASFFHLILLTMFEMRFLVSTYRVQRPERRSTPAPTTLAPAATITDLPAPATATIIPPTAAAISPADELRSELGALHTRFYFALITTLFLTLHATSWPPYYRDMFLHTILALTNSYLVPQIYRNVMRGTRQPFAAEFVVGTSLCRFTVVAYLYLYPHNVFGVEPNGVAVALLAGWVWIQCCLLAGQAVLGGRFFIPRAYGGLPEVFDYHRAVDADDEETGLLQERSSENCAVCMQAVEIPKDGRVLERRQYMITPCRHVFHSECLEGWMRYKLECPVCRNALPAL